ncbi:single-stranded DNA-binding protein [Nesterenkonia sp.]|uniref:single-stranded DNA-binding protein n=1 Tax=Nesterenkonia sp. TaxID=704201 RepID=UPI002634BF0F|nr:single-stranded DNA-binding protein [Nesterenkonia sp.]
MSDIITVRGFAGTNPELKNTDPEHRLTTFRLGSTPRWKDSVTGEWSSGPTNWYTVAAFGRLAEHVGASVRKGEPVVVVGRLKVRRWESDDGDRGTEVEINAQAVGHDLTYGMGRFTKVSSSSEDAPQASAAQSAHTPEEADSGSAPTAEETESASAAGAAADWDAQPELSRG